MEEISRETPEAHDLRDLITGPGFRALARPRTESREFLGNQRERPLVFELLEQPHWWTDPEIFSQLEDPLMRAAAWYFLRARNARAALPVDPVARFHLGNGARLERINWLSDTSERAIAQGYGLMVNYLYDLDDIEKNHEAYAEGPTVVASNAVQRLLRPAARIGADSPARIFRRPGRWRRG